MAKFNKKVKAGKNKKLQTKIQKKDVSKKESKKGSTKLQKIKEVKKQKKVVVSESSSDSEIDEQSIEEEIIEEKPVIAKKSQKQAKAAEWSGIEQDSSDSEESKNKLELDEDSDEEEKSAEVEEEEEEEESDEKDDDIADSDEESTEPIVPLKPTKAKTEKPKKEATQNSFQDQSDGAPSSRLFVRNIPDGSSSEDLKEFFESQSLNVVDIFVQGQKGYGFVEFKSIDEAKTAISLDGENFNGSQLSIAFAKPRNKDQSNATNCLFVKNLGPSTTEENLQSHFGKVKEVRLLTNPDGSCRGHGFVEFYSPNEATDALQKFNKSTVNGNKIEINYAQPRNNKFNQNRGGGGNNRYQNDRGGFRGNDSRGGRGGQFGNRGNRFSNNNRGGGRFMAGKSRGSGSFRGQSQRITFEDD